jgi:hypothetical protein
MDKYGLKLGFETTIYNTQIDHIWNNGLKQYHFVSIEAY